MNTEDFMRGFLADALGVDLASRPAAYDNFTEFKKLIMPDYQNPPHLQMLDEHLEQVELYVRTWGAEGIGRLMVEMPPRHGKSLTCSQLFPIWCLGRNPQWWIMMASYGVDLARVNSRIARNLTREPYYYDLFGVELAHDSKSVTQWNLEGHDGGVYALGVQGGATGKGAHILIPDDVIKNRAQAESITYRDGVYDALVNDLFTRLQKGGAVVMPNTRWHEDDPAGRLLKQGGWVRMRLPAMAEEDDLLGREIGAPLWPEMFSLDVLLDRQRELGPYPWASLYQQRPQPASGGILKREWFEITRHIPTIVESVRYWDLAMSSKTSADYTVGFKYGLGEDGNDYILDIVRSRVELHDLPRFIRDVILSDGRGVRQRFEKAGYMTRAIQQLARDRQLKPYDLRGVGVTTDKLTRVLPAAARASLGLVKMAYADWNRDFVTECVSFPNGEHDDQVDGFSGAYDALHMSKPATIKTETRRWA
jgi:predicted phage terminase large subunit-like protein